MDTSLHVRMVGTLLVSAIAATIILGGVGLALVGVALLVGAPIWTGIATTVLFALAVAVWARVTDAEMLSQEGEYVVDQSEYPQVGQPLQRLAAQAGTQVPDLAVVGTDDPFAFAYSARGHGPRIVVSLGLLDVLEPKEQEAVLAHELAHLLNRDMTVMRLGFFPIRIAETVQAIVSPDDGERGGTTGRRLDQSVYAWMLYDIAVGLERVGILATAHLASARELAADRGAVELTGDPAALSTALETLYERSDSPSHELCDADRARLLNIAPVGGTMAGLYNLTTHPDLDERQRQLRELTAEMEAA